LAIDQFPFSGIVSQATFKAAAVIAAIELCLIAFCQDTGF
jgi:hypothetical protein